MRKIENLTVPSVAKTATALVSSLYPLPPSWDVCCCWQRGGQDPHLDRWHLLSHCDSPHCGDCWGLCSPPSLSLQWPELKVALAMPKISSYLSKKFNYFWISPSVENPNDGEGILGPCVIWTIHQARVTSGHSWTSSSFRQVTPSTHGSPHLHRAGNWKFSIQDRFNSLFFVVPLPIFFLLSGLEKIQWVLVQKSFTTSYTGGNADKSLIQNI